MTRSIWKGPFVDGYLLKKAEKAQTSGRNDVVKIWSRSAGIFIAVGPPTPRIRAMRRDMKRPYSVGTG